MSVLVNKDTRVVTQGITGQAGRFHALACRDYGTRMVAGVTPGKGGSRVDGIPVFDTVERAVQAEGATTSMVFVPPAHAADAIMEAADAGIELVVCITEGIPILDMVGVKRFLTGRKSRLVGPNCPGVITPGECKIGIMPGHIHRQGTIGVVSRSGTLTYEAVDQLTRVGLGQSTCVGIGGDPIHGVGFIEILELFAGDARTEGIVMIGEIGGQEEEEAAVWIKNNLSKPVVGFIAGQTAPEGKRMGHAGAIISGGRGTAQDKVRALVDHGIAVATTPADMGECMQRVLRQRRR